MKRAVAVFLLLPAIGLAGCGPTVGVNQTVPQDLLTHRAEARWVYPGAKAVTRSGHTAYCQPERIFASTGTWSDAGIGYEFRSSAATADVAAWYRNLLEQDGWSIETATSEHLLARRPSLGREEDTFDIRHSGSDQWVTVLKAFTKAGACSM